jgi:uncharacterized protein YutE (UPF0331/DUF86 family)
MTGAPIRAVIVAEKISFIREMVEAVRRLPLTSYDEFAADFRNAGAAESYLRRALEALFDLGRHVLAKGFAMAPGEYKEIASALVEQDVLSKEEGRLLRIMAGYRNRMVHFYHEIGAEELYNICRNDLSDIESISDAFVKWLRVNPDKIDNAL